MRATIEAIRASNVRSLDAEGGSGVKFKLDTVHDISWHLAIKVSYINFAVQL